MARKYSTATQEKVHEEMHEMKEGQLTSGRSGKKVTDPKQAIAIALSEARKEGKKAPPEKTTTKKSSAKAPVKKTTEKKATTKKTATKKKAAAPKKAAAKKTASKKSE